MNGAAVVYNNLYDGYKMGQAYNDANCHDYPSSKKVSGKKKCSRRKCKSKNDGKICIGAHIVLNGIVYHTKMTIN